MSALDRDLLDFGVIEHRPGPPWRGLPAPVDPHDNPDHDDLDSFYAREDAADDAFERVVRRNADLF